MLKPSLLEQKRMQWAREQAELQEWAPWGRPGGGAPPVRTTGYHDDNIKRCSTSISIRADSLFPPLEKPEAKNGRRSRPTSFYRVADPCALNDAEGETSGYHSENNGNALISDGKMMERKRWIPDALPSAAFTNNVGDAYVDVQASHCHSQQQMLPQIAERFQPPRWAERNTSAAFPAEQEKYATQHKTPVADSAAVYYQQGNYLQNFVNQPGFNDTVYNGSERTAVSAVSSFLRGQNAPVDPAVLAEREVKRRQATELQRALLEQLAEKERKKAEERERQRQEEQREEERLRRQLLMEQRQMEEERRRLEEKQIQEEKKVKAIHEAIEGAKEQALREKRSRRQFLEKREPSPCPPPASHRSTTNLSLPAVPTILPRQFVHTAVQTELEPTVQQCQCGRSSTRQSKTNDESASENSKVGGTIRTTARQSTAESRPMWGVNQPSRKYMTQTEKDPRCLKNRRDRMRRKQRALMEKQMHGSWPSSETSGSREDVYGYVSGSSKNKTYYEFPKISEHRVPAVKELDVLDVEKVPADARSTSPPVPAVLKKLQNAAAGKCVDNYDWDEFEKDDNEAKITKDMANMKIKDGRLTPTSEMKKEDILFKLSLLRKGLEQRRSDAETMSTVSSVVY